MSFQRKTISLVVACLLVALVCGTVASQSKKARREPNSRVRRELIYTPSEPPRKIGQASVSYEADRNTTFAGVSFLVVSGPDMGAAELAVGFSVKDKQLKEPDVVSFRLTTYGPARGFFRGRAIFELQSGGRVFRLANVLRRNESFSDLNQQSLSGDIPFAQFKQIVVSDQISVRAVTRSYALRESDREAFRDLLRAAAGAPFEN